MSSAIETQQSFYHNVSSCTENKKREMDSPNEDRTKRYVRMYARPCSAWNNVCVYNLNQDQIAFLLLVHASAAIARVSAVHYRIVCPVRARARARLLAASSLRRCIQLYGCWASDAARASTSGWRQRDSAEPPLVQLFVGRAVEESASSESASTCAFRRARARKVYRLVVYVRKQQGVVLLPVYFRSRPPRWFRRSPKSQAERRFFSTLRPYSKFLWQMRDPLSSLAMRPVAFVG